MGESEGTSEFQIQILPLKRKLVVTKDTVGHSPFRRTGEESFSSTGNARCWTADDDEPLKSCHSTQTVDVLQPPGCCHHLGLSWRKEIYLFAYVPWWFPVVGMSLWVGGNWDQVKLFSTQGSMGTMLEQKGVFYGNICTYLLSSCLGATNDHNCCTDRVKLERVLSKMAHLQHPFPPLTSFARTMARCAFSSQCKECIVSHFRCQQQFNNHFTWTSIFKAVQDPQIENTTGVCALQPRDWLLPLYILLRSLWTSSLVNKQWHTWDNMRINHQWQVGLGIVGTIHTHSAIWIGFT